MLFSQDAELGKMFSILKEQWLNIALFELIECAEKMINFPPLAFGSNHVKF